MESPYSQAPLDLSGSSFRLVELQPCGPTDVIKCRLTTHPLPPDCPSYIALSYMWDHESPPDTIVLNDVPFQVGHSLWTFLNQMRLHKKFGMYWIDALCIDQSNIRERNHQVQMMKSIYSEAASVSIWLGEAEEGSSRIEAMDLMASLQDDPSSFRDWTTQQVESIAEFSELAYWNRMWIVQEVVLANTPTIYCGSRMLGYSLLASLMSKSHDNGSDNLRTLMMLPADTLRMLAEGLSGGTAKNRLARAVVFCRDRKATDVRNKVYALLGVLGREALSIPVDYDMTIEELWAIFFSCICRTHQRIESLTHIRYLAAVAQRSVGIESSREDASEKMINTMFLSRPPPPWLRELLELPNAPNEAVYFEMDPTDYNPKGLLAVHEASMRAKAIAHADPRAEHQ